MPASHSMYTPVPASEGRIRRTAQVAATVFLVIGVSGFVPGLTTHLDQLSFAGQSGALLLGIFGVSVLHNLIHVVFAIIGFALARELDGARVYLVGGGAVYLALFITGLLIQHDGSAGVLPGNDVGSWLHFGFAVVMIAVGVGDGAHRDPIR